MGPRACVCAARGSEGPRPRGDPVLVYSASRRAMNEATGAIAATADATAAFVHMVEYAKRRGVIR